MNKNENLTTLIDKAIAGDRSSLGMLILGDGNLIFNTHLSPFKQGILPIQNA